MLNENDVRLPDFFTHELIKDLDAFAAALEHELGNPNVTVDREMREKAIKESFIKWFGAGVDYATIIISHFGKRTPSYERLKALKMDLEALKNE